MSVYVDIPQASCVNDADGAFKHVAAFKTRREAIAFCQEHFGADEEGRVSLVSGSDDGEDTLSEQEINRRMEIAQDIKKAFHYSKGSGKWTWCDSDEYPDWSPPDFDTFTAALIDATQPYVDEEARDGE